MTKASSPQPGVQHGDVVAVRFPFTDQTGAKSRPAIVVSALLYNTATPDLLIASLRVI